jgi:ATP-dependent RNA helicase DeaD
MSQAQRDAVMRRFRDKNLKLLIATDVAARGIDVDDLTHVVHFALPDDPEFYTHRSGRTARAGKKGISLAMVTKGDNRRLRFLEKKLDISFSQASIPALDEIIAKRINRWCQSIVDQEIGGDISDNLFYDTRKALEEITKDQMIGKLLTRELEKIKRPSSIKNINDKSAYNDDDSTRRKKNDRGKEEGMTTFFINVGEMDKMNKGALLGFLCDMADISGKQVGRIAMDRKHSYVDVEDSVADKVIKIDGLPYNGRELRVNEHRGRVSVSNSGRKDRKSGFKKKENKRGRGGFKGKKW